MKNRVYELISILGLILIMVSCGGSGDSPSPEPPVPTELEVPKILSPQKDAVCEGIIDAKGAYTVTMTSSSVFGADKYVFTLYDASGTKLSGQESTSPNVSFESVPAGAAYTVMVQVVNAGGSKESTRVPFSTPGLKVVNYVPVVKSAVYDKNLNTLNVVFHDKESSAEGELFYTVLCSVEKTFPEDGTKTLESNVKVSSNKEVSINLDSAAHSVYYRLQVKDAEGNMSSHDIHVLM